MIVYSTHSYSVDLNAQNVVMAPNILQMTLKGDWIIPQRRALSIAIRHNGSIEPLYPEVMYLQLPVEGGGG